MYEVVDVHDETQGATSWWVIDVNYIRDFDGTSDAVTGDNIRVKIFSAPIGADAATFLSKYGDDVQDATAAADYKWNTAVSFQSAPGVELKSDAITAKDNAGDTFIATTDPELTTKKFVDDRFDLLPLSGAELMSQELDDALFLVQRGTTHYRSAGVDIGERMVAGDMVLVQRGTDHFKATYNGTDRSPPSKTTTSSLPGTAPTTARFKV